MKIKKLLIATTMLISVSYNSASASGIPIGDATSIVKMIESQGLSTQLLSQFIEVTELYSEQLELIGKIKDGEFDKILDLSMNISESYEKFGLRRIIEDPKVNSQGKSIDLSTSETTQKTITEVFYLNKDEAKSVDAINNVRQTRQAAVDIATADLLEILQVSQNHIKEIDMEMTDISERCAMIENLAELEACSLKWGLLQRELHNIDEKIALQKTLFVELNFISQMGVEAPSFTEIDGIGAY